LIPLSVRSPPASTAYTLTFARLAEEMTERNCPWTFAVRARPSEKKTTVLRPGIAFRPLTTARRPLLVA
jgi:hypothetical protein